MTVRRKVCVVVASRANYGRIKSVLASCRSHPNIELQIIATASAVLSRFGHVVEVMRRDGFSPDANIHVVLEGNSPLTMVKSTGFAIQELGTAFELLRPDIVLTVADRYETLATAVAASYMNIHVAHTQGGEVTGSIDESVRHAITKLSHLHFVTTALSKARVLQMGEDPSRVYLTGCPAMDAVDQLDMALTPELLEKYDGTGAPIDLSRPYLMVLQHPVTTEHQSAGEQIVETIEAARRLAMPTLWLWPNIDAGTDHISYQLRQFCEVEKPSWLRIHRNFSVEDYARLINGCACLIGNSSSALREGAFLGTPAVNIGSRQRNRERGANVIDADSRADDIETAVRAQLRHGRYPRDALFGDGKAGRRIADILSTAELGSAQKQFFDVR
ncbi:UDP-N-acetylglucosamine 2-epimerase [Rhizobium paknamense]|uniref:UDP-hydrolyzing UDP-N-acetyl-D-glucosamine 2-epimerase n=1 Tax=Rhizobium paknamense TaxID=1206817 RepID=A0ABU0IME0_9HYPH|nr:UDP-N-acetylglucosamine 2-epimerase [Rhizobium paknamense]MDQ0458364.1 UDP-hydrolyzing UDP-N-acetyl-D-glucosamine 2-epimerase [Rhizobium paknamense]